MKEAISAAEEKRFSEFSKKVKTSLEDKLRNNDVIQSKAEELSSFQNMRDTFSQIAQTPTDTEQ